MNRSVEALQHRVADVRDRIERAGGDPDRVTLVAVTKGFGVEQVSAAVAAGVVDIGENYAQELAGKAEALDANEPEIAPRWHFIGRLQRNKIRLVSDRVHLWQSVDRIRLGEEIANRAPGAGVLVQVNLTEDPERGGCRPAMAPGLVDGLRDLGLDVRGLMAVGPPGGAEQARDGFRLVRALADRLGLTERSMGMTGDLEIAIEEGSTMVRVGTALFGQRPL